MVVPYQVFEQAGKRCKPALLSPLAKLAPEEEIWLAMQKSARTRRACKLDVQHFMKTLHITTCEELRKADHRGDCLGAHHARD
jgi:hypothetical protein